MCVSHRWEISFAGDRTFFRCKECGETFSIKTEERACPKQLIEKSTVLSNSS
jgi:transposase-like protein